MVARPTRPAPPKPVGKTAPKTAAPARPAPTAPARPTATSARPAPTAPVRPTAAPARPTASAAPARPAPTRPAAPARPAPPSQAEQVAQDDRNFVNGADDGQGRFEQEQHQEAQAPAPRPAAPTNVPARIPAQPRQAAPAPRPTPPTGLSIPLPAGVVEGTRYDQMPEWMRQDANLGTESISTEDMGIVQIKLMQALSPELTEYEGIRAGDFWHSGAGINLGPAFWAIFLLKQTQYILWNPREAGGGILARAPDGVHWSPPDREFVVQLDKKDGGDTVVWRTARTVLQSGLHDWGSQNPNVPNSPPAATKMQCLLTIPYEYQEAGPAILTFQRTSLRYGAKLMSKIKTFRGPLFSMLYLVSSFQDTNANGQSFFNMKAEGGGRVPDQDLYDYYKSMHEGFARSGVDIRNIEDLQEEHIPEGGDGDAYAQGQPAY